MAECGTDVYQQVNKITHGVSNCVFSGPKLEVCEFESVDWESSKISNKSVKVLTKEGTASIEKTLNISCLLLLVLNEENSFITFTDAEITIYPINFKIKKTNKVKTEKIKSNQYNGLQIVSSNLILYKNGEIVQIIKLPNN